jgi:V/A-type H+-transporting ATPase subunit E
MDTKGIIDKILSDANVEADKIKSEASKQLAVQKTGLENHLKQYNQETEVLANKAADDKYSQMLAAARMKNAKMMLEQKRELLNDIFVKAADELTKLDDKQYKDVMKKLMIKAVETGDEEVIVDVNEKRIDQGFIKHVNRELGPGFKGNLRLSNEKEDIKGGFILQRGKIRNNVSARVLVEKARKDLEADIAKELFAKAN